MDKTLSLTTLRLPEEDHAALTSIRDSRNSDSDTFAPLVRLYIRMGLMLHRSGISTLDQLRDVIDGIGPDETQLQRLEDLLWKRLQSRVERQAAEGQHSL